MGRDKAGLLIDGEMLWERQWKKLRLINAAEAFIVGRPDGPYWDSGIPVVFDRIRDSGPLAGLDAAWHASRCDWLLVLAVDLVDLPAWFLVSLVQEASAAGHGMVPAYGEWLQPIAAIYPRATHAIIEECLAEGQLALRHFYHRAVEAGLVAPRPVTAEEYGCFRNLNTPADLSSSA